MDPVSALSVAASVVQFVEFASSLVSSTYEIYQSASGGSAANVDLESITSSLKALNADLRHSLSRAASGKELSAGDLELNKVCINCEAVTDRLISALRKLKAQKKHSIWDSFGRALLTVWSKEEVEALQKQLNTFRHQISLQIIASIREQVGRLQADQSSHGQLISSSLQATQDLSQTILKQMDQSARWQARVIDVIHSGRWYWDVEAVPVTMQDQFFRGYAERFRNSILASLQYVNMESRAESVLDAYGETFQWIFSRPKDERQKSSNFRHFLESNQGLYWITDKPGSGKSTIMKFISENHRTKYHLHAWASGKKLYMSEFYFWCSGANEIQMTQEGLLRTLIHEALQAFPHLVPLLFPNRLRTFVIFGDQVVWEEPWTFAELLRAFNLFVGETTKSTKIFFLLDGLDEFYGNYSQQVKLIEFIHSLLSADVKICVSSRPWIVFEDAFNTRPSLRLEDLTYPDIQNYVSSRLSANLGFVALQRGDSQSASSLIDNVSTKACGVFLWVTLVVQSLLEGLTYGERLSDLQKRLDSLPADLEALFWRILNSVDFERISQLFQMVRASTEPLDLGQVSFADEDDPEFIFKLPTAPLSGSILISRAELMRRRLNACCKGLLEPQTNAQFLPRAVIGYLHRTVKDFIQKPDIWNKLLSATEPSFDPVFHLCVSRIACLKTAYTDEHSKDHEYSISFNAVGMDRASSFWRCALSSMQLILISRPERPEIQLRFLEELKGALDPVMARGTFGIDPISYADCPLSKTIKITSFLHLAVKLQAEPYVKAHVNDLQGPKKNQELSLLLQTAVTEYICHHADFKIRDPSPPIVETLLQHGANFDRTFGNTDWNYALQDSQHRPELLMLLLHYGTDPFALRLRSPRISGDSKEVWAFAKVKREEARRPGGRRKSKKKTASKENTEQVGNMLGSTWSRLRSRYSLGEKPS